MTKISKEDKYALLVYVVLSSIGSDDGYHVVFLWGFDLYEDDWSGRSSHKRISGNVGMVIAVKNLALSFLACLRCSATDVLLASQLLTPSCLDYFIDNKIRLLPFSAFFVPSKKCRFNYFLGLIDCHHVKSCILKPEV